MRILVVDDLPKKIKAVIDVLVDNCGLARNDIEVAQCATEARRILSSKEVDLLIIDLVLPLRAEDAPSVQVSLELVEQITEDESYIRPAYILGLTAFSDAIDQASAKFREHLWHVLYYDESTNDWSRPIQNAVDHIRRRQLQVTNTGYQTDVCLLTALIDPEMKAIQRLPWAWEPPAPLDDTTFVRRAKVEIDSETYSIVCATAPRMGMVASSLTAAKMIDAFRPRLIAMTGICAGLQDKTNLGDIIFIDASWDWQSGKRQSEGKKRHFNFSPHQLVAPEFLRARATEISGDPSIWSDIKNNWPSSPSHELRLHIGPVASGSAVLADAQIVTEIKTQHRNLIGIEMEAYGVFAAAACGPNPRPLPLVLKSVCDFADEDKNDSMQSYAAFTSASALHVFLSRYLPDVRKNLR